MATLQTPVVQILFWLVAAAATVWILGPGVMHLLGRSRYWVELSANPKDAEPDGRDRKYETRFGQFMALGFKPIGKIVERMTFMSPLHWNWSSGGSRQLVSPDGKTVVSSYRIAGGNPLRTTAVSMFNEGGMIQTASPGVAMNLDAGPNYRYEAVGETEPEELLEMHARRVEAFTRDRKLTVKPATIRDFAAETELYFNRVRAQLKLGQSGSTVMMFLIPTVMLLWTAVRGRAPWFVPVGICGAAALFAVVRWSILPGRVPMMVRMAAMMVVLTVPSLGGVWFVSSDKVVTRILDRLESGTKPRDPSRVVARIVEHGPRACEPLLKRLEDPATKPETRTIIHDALVKLNGSDLGDTPAAWQGWCAGVLSRRN